MIKQYFFASYNIKNRFISHTSKGEFSVVFLKEIGFAALTIADNFMFSKAFGYPDNIDVTRRVLELFYWQEDLCHSSERKPGCCMRSACLLSFKCEEITRISQCGQK